MIQYFQHDTKARTDFKLLKVQQKYGMAGIGAYWCMVEMIYEENGGLQMDSEGIAFALRTDCDMIASLLNDFNLFYFEGGLVRSFSIDKRIEIIKDKSIKASESAKKRWENSISIDKNADNGNKNVNNQGNKKDNANAMRTHNERNAIKVKVKEKENKIDSLSPAHARSPESLEQVEQLAAMCGTTKEVAEVFYNRGNANGWVTAVGSNIVPVQDWRSLFRSRCKLIESDLRTNLARNERNGVKGSQDTFEAKIARQNEIIDNIFKLKQEEHDGLLLT
jgi:uncharacterized protein YdaU (DUF1376 family)